jgi:hypothetical protein
VVEVDSTRLVRDATVGMLTHLDGDNEVDVPIISCTTHRGLTSLREA